MIILPDRNIARAKYLTPLHYKQWRPPIWWEGRETGNVLGVYFIVQAFRSNGEMVWKGWFEDREDADEFMYSVVTANIRQDRYIQRLPQKMPWSEGGIDPTWLYEEGIFYNLVSLGAIGPSTANWTVPGDCYGFRSRAGEFCDVIGPGGGGGAGCSGASAAGGGGGGWARIYSYAMSPGQAYTYVISAGAAGADVDAYNGTSGVGAGAAGTWFISSGVLYCTGGGGGNYANGQTTGGAGGGGVAGAIGYTGGRGGTSANYPYSGGGGGGGGCGPNGNGSQGGDGGGAQYAQTAGGNGNGNQIGGGGAGGAAGANGNWYGPWGPGGGGGGARPLSSTVNGRMYGGPGGHYGGGGGGVAGPGGNAGSRAIGGAGGGGLLVYAYEPTATIVVSSVTPSSGPTTGGQYVTIGGSGFVGISSANIGGAPITSMSVPHQGAVVGYTSAGGAGTYNVNVYGPYMTGVGGSLYTYVTPPSVSSAAPASGPTTGGNYVAIYGANMSGVTSITFNGVAGTSISNINANGVQCYAPAGAAGAATVIVSNAYGSGSGVVYTFVTPPSLSAITSPVPAIGLIFGGTDITMTGANLAGTTSVMVGGIAATNLVVVDANTLTFKTPPHAKGVVSITATNGYGTATLANCFTYLLPASGFNMPMMGI